MLGRTSYFFFFSLLMVVGAYITWAAYRATSYQHVPTPPVTCTEGKSIQHVGIIMDGNRRWAKQHGHKPWIGHKKGVEPVRTSLEFCIKNNIPYLTLYVFSLENFNRPQEELSYLFDILAQQISDSELDKLFQEGVMVKFIGDKKAFPEKLASLIQTIEEKTKDGKKLTLHLLFCYGGQQEIVAACQQIATRCAQGTLKPEEITPALFKQHLWSGACPPPDLIIRTAGDQRLSNFLTWDSSYSELAFLPCFWPEITEEMLADTLEKYYLRKRTFGK